MRAGPGYLFDIDSRGEHHDPVCGKPRIAEFIQESKTVHSGHINIEEDHISCGCAVMAQFAKHFQSVAGAFKFEYLDALVKLLNKYTIDKIV